MKRIVLFILVAIYFTQAFSSNIQIDSLLVELHHVSGKDKVTLLNKIAGEYMHVSPAKTIEYGKLAYDLANTLNDQLGKNLALYYIGMGYFNSHFDHQTALSYAFRASKESEEAKDTVGMMYALNLLGIIYQSLGDYAKAIEINLKLLTFSRAHKDNAKEVACLTNLGRGYRQLKDYKNALIYYSQGLALAKKTNQTRTSAYILEGIGSIYYAQGDFKKSIEYELQSLEIFKQYGASVLVADNLINLGLAYRRLGDLNNAISYIDQGYKLAKESHSKEMIRRAYENYSYYYRDVKDFKRAYEYHIRFKSISDSIYSEQSQKRIAEMQVKYETEKNQQQIKQLETENQLKVLQISRARTTNIAFAVVLLLLVLMVLMFVRQNKMQMQQKTVQLEHKLLRLQMNPHFIFNMLDNVHTYIYENKSQEAKNFLERFAVLLRLILENSREEHVVLEKEVKTIENYLVLQALHYENKFSYTLHVDSSLDPEIAAIPPMLAQPFIENAIEHGIKHKEGQGEIFISFKRVQERLVFEVQDNGIGLEKAAQYKGSKSFEHHSLATVITKERLALLNRRKRNKIHFSVEEIKNNENFVQGTKVIFDIPYKII